MAYCMHMVGMMEMDEALEQKALLGATCQAGEGVWKPGPWMVDLLSWQPDQMRMGGGMQVALNEK